MMARSLKRSINRPDTEAQDHLLQIITFGLQRAAGTYRWATLRLMRCSTIEETQTKRPPLAAASLKSDVCFDQAAPIAAAFFRFLRQPNKPNALRPVAKSGRAAGTGVAVTGPLPTPGLKASE